jgi:hypothetical protein
MEDETKVLSEDDPSKAPTTHMMIETVLARMNAGFAEVKQRLTAIEMELKEMKRNQRVFHETMLRVRGAEEGGEELKSRKGAPLQTDRLPA